MYILSSQYTVFLILYLLSYIMDRRWSRRFENELHACTLEAILQTIYIQHRLFWLIQSSSSYTCSAKTHTHTICETRNNPTRELIKITHVRIRNSAVLFSRFLHIFSKIQFKPHIFLLFYLLCRLCYCYACR